MAETRRDCVTLAALLAVLQERIVLLSHLLREHRDFRRFLLQYLREHSVLLQLRHLLRLCCRCFLLCCHNESPLIPWACQRQCLRRR